ncbi:MAG: O-methyltransferase [Steroidobacteraceae bacterium]
MTTLTDEPCATAVRRMFAEAGLSEARLEAHGKVQATDDIDRLMQSGDCRALYGALKEFHLAVSMDVATLLYLLARAIVEFGTSFGVSTVHLAAARRDNGAGRLIGTGFEPSKVKHARANIAAAGPAGLVDIRAGDALGTLAAELPEPLDVLFLDGAKTLYVRMLAMLEPRLRVSNCRCSCEGTP